MYKKILYVYKIIAILVFNTVIFFFLLNVGAWVILTLKTSENEYSQIQLAYDQFLLQLYPGMSDDEIKQLLRETASRPFVFESFIDYKNMPFAGKYVNVSETGYRHSDPQGPWPPDNQNFNVFLFGGSTTFGWGVSDKETVATYLQEKLDRILAKNVFVYNFGTEHYYSTIERILFEQLLLKNYIPDIAIFIDGMNEFANSDNEHINAEPIKLCFTQERFKISFVFKKVAETLPITKLIGRYVFSSKPETVSSVMTDSGEHLVRRYLTNKKIIQSTGQALGVKTFFAWQPIPNYKPNPKGYLFSDQLAPEYIGSFNLAPSGYAQIEQMDNKLLGDNFIFCADIQETLDILLYIDRLHYSGSFSEKIAECILQGISQNALHD